MGLSGRGAGRSPAGFLDRSDRNVTVARSWRRATYALAISNSGDVAGLSTDAAGTRHAVRWRSSAGWAVEDLGTLGGCCSEGYGINTFGDVVGVSNVWANVPVRNGHFWRVPVPP